MEGFHFIQHSNLKQEELYAICDLKSFSWPYSREKQLQWIANNITPQDLHILYYENNIPEAYMNLIAIEMNTDGKKQAAWGIGNVCARHKGKGTGGKLMKEVNGYLKEHATPGLLLCKKELTDFYTKYDWILLNNEQLDVNVDLSRVYVMAFNILLPLKQLRYNGRTF